MDVGFWHSVHKALGWGPQNYIILGWWHIPVHLALGRERQVDQKVKFKVIVVILQNPHQKTLSIPKLLITK